MSSKNGIQLIKKELQKEITADEALPNMSPDILDDFITYVHERVDLYSFQRSDIAYKLRMYKNFIKQLPYEKRQLKLFV